MINVAVIGTGNIAKRMSKTLNALDGIKAYAICSRSLEKGKEFAKEFSFDMIYEDYDQLLLDENINLIYIANPHSLHYEYGKKALEANKHVLMEKAFTINENQAIELIKMAHSKNLVLVEGLWTRFLPSRQIINDIIESGVIGKKVSLLSQFGNNLTHINRMEDATLGGGALLDLGVYVLNTARMYFTEEVEEITSQSDYLIGDVDRIDNICIKYKDGTMANLHCNSKAVIPAGSIISGTEGYIEISGCPYPNKIHVVSNKNAVDKIYPIPERITGLEYEILSVVNSIKEGKCECNEMPHSETLYILRQMDQLRKDWGYCI